MAILEFFAGPSRNGIGLVEHEPPSPVPAVLAGYELYRFDEAHLTDHARLAQTGAILFRQLAEKPGKVREQLARYAACLLSHDCRVFVEPVPAQPGQHGAVFRKMLVNALQTLGLPPAGLSTADMKGFDGLDARLLTPWVYVLSSQDSWSEIARILRDYPPGRSPRMDCRILDSHGQSVTLNEEQHLLVRRAFSDCGALQLIEITNGLSKVRTFRAFAESHDVVGSRWPYLYFVKIGERAKVMREFLAYRERALEHVPYHLGPRLRLERCALGPTQGIIVADYVSGAETLRDCASDGRAVPVIASLFNSTLRAWRNAARSEARLLQDYLVERILEIPGHREPLIRRYEAVSSIDALKQSFLNLPSQPVLVGVAHGDLHATNVLVRGNDAIIIDFEKVQDGFPLLWDMACLEGGLFVDGFVNYPKAGFDLLKAIECLYEPSAFDGDIPYFHPATDSAWFFECVRQIRMQAREIEFQPRQYALALAVAFARKGCNPENFREDQDGESVPSVPLEREDVRALAYVIAERILEGLASKRTRGST